MNKKGYTLIELIAVIVLLAVIMGIATFSLSKYLVKGRSDSFDLLINTFEDSVREAYATCVVDPDGSEFCKNHEIPDHGQSSGVITLQELEDEYFIKPLKNPWNNKEKCDPDSAIIAISDAVDSNKGSKDNISLTYVTCLKCGTHESEGCDALRQLQAQNQSGESNFH